ncbi:MAG: hypothetical protein ASARMPRED_002179 [Alectoria sarmentosa]|nr:MAG: hypothetical protein ASARMPRED_002179 [Alectoria sarmentosa]
MASQAQNGVDRSAIALGLGFSQWTRNDLSVILNQYGVRPAIGDSNNTLIDKLNQLALERGLTRVDRLAILKAHKAGLRLPPRRPLVRDPTSSLAPPQNAAPPPVITHTEDYSSGANDDSDVEVSDDELVEELVSLSEEERDLREYTATMSLPRNSEQRRTLRPRSAANPIANRPMSTSLPEAMIYPPVRHRPAVRNRPVHTLSSHSRQHKLTVIFNDVARRDASPASNVSLKILSCIVKNVAIVRASIAISKCITACHAARKLRSAKSPSSVESLPLQDTSKSELKSARVAALLLRRQAVVIMLHVKCVAMNTAGSVSQTTDPSTKKGMNTMPQIANTTPTIFDQQ